MLFLISNPSLRDTNIKFHITILEKSSLMLVFGQEGAVYGSGYRLEAIILSCDEGQYFFEYISFDYRKPRLAHYPSLWLSLKHMALYNTLVHSFSDMVTTITICVHGFPFSKQNENYRMNSNLNKMCSVENVLFSPLTTIIKLDWKLPHKK